MASSNPFRRNKQAQILGIDNPNVINSQDDISIRNLKNLGRSQQNHHLFPRRADILGRVRKDPHSGDASIRSAGRDSDSASVSKRSQNSADDASSFSTSVYNAVSPDELDNPFDEDAYDESLEDHVPISPLSRRRTMPEKAAQLTGVAQEEGDAIWRGASKLSALPSLRQNNNSDLPDRRQIPLKAQKMLGISRHGRVGTDPDYRNDQPLSPPQRENVAPKAQKMLGIGSNPFQKAPSFEDRRQFYGDELDQHGIMGPTASESPRRNMEEFRRMHLANDKEYIYPPYFSPIRRENGSNTDVSSLSHSSLVSSPADSNPLETPRSSHEAMPRARINTESYLSTSNASDYPPPSPGSFDDYPASLNKPLPPRPGVSESTFELAGSTPVGSAATPPAQMPNPSKRRLLQQTRRAAAKAMQHRPYPGPDQIQTANSSGPVELPAEPAEPYFGGNILSSPTEGPGSQFDPVELPAREATPIDSPPRHSFRSSIASIASTATHIASQVKHPPPAVPPPRRGGSNRNTIILPAGISELEEKSSCGPQVDTAKAASMRNSFATDQAAEARGASRHPLPLPPNRAVSAKQTERFTNAARSSPNSSTEDFEPSSPPKTPGGASSVKSPSSQPVYNLPPPSYPPPSGKLPPTPPPPRHRASSDTDLTPSQPSTDANETTPINRQFENSVSPARLPKLQTQMRTEAPSLTDQLVSALSPESYSRNPFSPGDTVSVMSFDGSMPGSASKKPSLGSIAMAVAKHSHAVAPDRRPSKQEMAHLDAVVNDSNKSDKEKIDVLADLGVLQREVDALRRQFVYPKNGSSSRSGSQPGRRTGRGQVSNADTDSPRNASSGQSQPASEYASSTASPDPANANSYKSPTRSGSSNKTDTFQDASEHQHPSSPIPHPGVEWDPAKAAGAESSMATETPVRHHEGLDPNNVI